VKSHDPDYKESVATEKAPSLAVTHSYQTQAGQFAPLVYHAI
jgi:hypothetical protein